MSTTPLHGRMKDRGARDRWRARGQSAAKALLLGSLLMMAGLVWLGASAAAQTPTKGPKAESEAAGNAATGKKLYVTYGCYECHGRAAHGGTGPRLGPDALPLAIFVQYVRHPGGTMPPYTAKVVTDQELADIYAFLKSLPEPPQAKDLPLLKQ